MAMVFLLTIKAEGGRIDHFSAHSSAARARQALIDWVADHGVIDPTDDVIGGDACPEDWYFEPTAFDIAMGQLDLGGFTGTIDELTIDPE